MTERVLSISDQAMNWHMGEVLPGLYVGSYHDSKDRAQLERFQISHIVAVHDSPKRLLLDKHYLCVMASDMPDQNLAQYFSVCNDFIHAARLREGNVLIHCLAGMSRSVTVAVAYIMTSTHLNWKEALKVVRAGRTVANPNTGFQNQLQEFEQFKLSEERRRLRERFPSSALEQLDRLKVATALLQNRDICEGNSSRGEKSPTDACIPAFDANADKGAVPTNVAYTLQFAVDKRKPVSSGQHPKKLHKEISEGISCGEEIMPNVLYYKANGSIGRFDNEFLFGRNEASAAGAGGSNPADQVAEPETESATAQGDKKTP
ncbi:dual specificity protein phosphatase 22 [Drosophila persimilis]|uniref:dual specificity protein phosphatase 22 n=1 Tax=Drosophila persimilis TaxID=7234 RepID=UPI000F08A43B|nr:dual specificity protein phosphatase 22 [Drosophila persimilis]